MRASTLLSILFLLPCTLFAQNNISGVINTYYKVIGVNYVKSGVRLDNVTGLVSGDRVMIIQMKGATVNTTITSNSFGSVTALNEAGNYELATVCAVRSDSVFFIQQLLRTYNPVDQVQLVRIPRYASATVTAPLEAAQWDSATGKGGVLALIVSGTLTLNSSLSATAKGFKGGVFYKDGGGCGSNAFQNYAYDPTPSTYSFYSNVQRGGWKGESITSLSLSISGGRGAAANGGGGGNNHNNAGGGGSNATTAGKGGDNQSTVGCQGSYAGIGGYAISTNSGDKIYLGGGGGAGHANNTTTSSGGGNGGGIVFIQAQTLVSNGNTISANGGTGGNTGGDGAGGGGGGGTIILSVTNFTDNVAIQCRGGNGGNEDDENISGRCYGEGGGGSGGVIYFTGALPAGSINLTGGTKGTKIMTTCATTTGANGCAGIQVTGYSPIESATASSCAGSLLSSYWKSFKISSSGNTSYLQWTVSNTNNTKFEVERKKNRDWVQIASIAAIRNQQEYSFSDLNLGWGLYQYRIKSISNGTIQLSPVKQVQIYSKQKEIIYNTPSRILTIKGPTYNQTFVQIFDATGRCVYQANIKQGQSNYRLNLSFLAPGLYIATMEKASCKFVLFN